MSNILITGSGSGLGAALYAALVADGHKVFTFDKSNEKDVRFPEIDKEVVEEGLDILVNCAAVNKINWLEDLSSAEFDEVMDTNAKAIYKMTQVLLPLLIESEGTVLNIVSNAATMPMRCSLAYNMSKAAALMATKQLARELTPRFGITVFSVSPNKLAGTGMSNSIDRQVMKTRGWTLEQTQAYQLKSLLTGKETPPERVAEFITFLLKDKSRHECLSGCDIPYGL